MALTSLINNLTWNTNNLFSADWRAVTWGGPSGNKQFVGVVGNTLLQKIGVSANGYEWTSVVDTMGSTFSGATGRVYKIIWDSVYNRYYAAGLGNNILAFSINSSGLSWQGLGNTGDAVGQLNNLCTSLASNKKSLRLVAVGKGAHSIYYSDNALPLSPTWTGVTGVSIFSDQGNAALWYGPRNLWIAAGQGTNTLATSPDGVAWTARGASIFSTAAYGLAFNPTKVLACGKGTNTLAYSFDGVNWYGSSSGNSVFTTAAYACVWTGSQWQAVGQGTNTLAYSVDGIYWIGLGSSVFTTAGYALTYTFNSSISVIVAVGAGTNTLAYSNNGTVWYGMGANFFTVAGYGIASNGLRFVAVGEGTNTILYSNNGVNWFTTGSTVFSQAAYSVAWSGTNWVALGKGASNTAAYSPDGVVWTGLGTLFSTLGQGINAKTPELIAVGTGSASITSSNTAYSPNGVWWWGVNSLMTNSQFAQVNAVANNGSTSSPLWVSGGGTSANSLAYSTDGFSWTATGLVTFSTKCNALVYANNLWVAVGEGTNSIAWSLDGVIWTGLGTSIFSTDGAGVAFNSTAAVAAIKWVAVGLGGTNNIATSDDGLVWIGQGLQVFGSGLGVANNNLAGASNLWVAVGTTNDTIAYSTNATSWTGTGRAVFTGSISANSSTLTVTLPTTLGTITVGMEITSTSMPSGTRIVSGSGTTWTVSPAIGATPVSSETITGYIFQSRGSAVAHNGGNVSATFTGAISGTVLTVSGVTGTITAGMGVTGTGVATNTVIVSGSGLTWTVNISQTVSPAVNMTGNTGRWVATGTGLTAAGGNTLAYSNDGVLWNGLGSSVFNSAGRSITYVSALNLWISGGVSLPVLSGFSLAYSSDGVNWTPVAQSPKTLSEVNSLSWNGSVLIAGGKNSNSTVSFAYSLNGTTWFGYGGYPSLTNGGQDVVYNPDQNIWLSAGVSINPICYSPNGVNWIATGSTVMAACNGIVWKGAPLNKWVALGNFTFAESTDGLNWSYLGAGALNTALYKVIYTDNKFVAVGKGDEASIATSSDGVRWTGVPGSFSMLSEGYGLDYDPTNNRVVAVGNRANYLFTSAANGVGYGGVDSAVFTGSMTTVMGVTTMTVTFILSGALKVGMVLRGSGVSAGTTITSGSGLSWVVTPTQTVASTQITGTLASTMSFTGSITGTSLVVNSLTSGVFTAGMTVSGIGVLPNTVIISGIQSPYTVSISQNTAQFTGTIDNGAGGSGNILTITTGYTGAVVVGLTISGSGVTAGTTVVSGSGTTWTVSGAPQNVTALITTGAFADDCVFTGTISGTLLTVNTVTSGFLVIGMRVTGAGVTSGTVIQSGSGSSWTLNISQTVSPAVSMTGTFSQLLTGTSGLFVAGGTGSITLAASPNGKTWIKLPNTLFVGGSVNGVTYGTGAVGFATFTGTISGTSLTVTSVTAGAIQLGMGIFVPGINLATVIISGTYPNYILNISSGVFTGTFQGTMDRWVAVGSGTNTVAVSNDGVAWQGRGTIGVTGCNDIAYAPMVLFTGGTGGVSSTVLTVTAVSQGFLYAGMLVTGTGIPALTTIGNQLSVTAGAAPWTTGTYSLSTASTVNNGTAIVGGHVWVIGALTSSPAYSLNHGCNWTNNSSNTLITSRCNGVAFGGPIGQQKFVVVGASAQTNGNCIGYSSDGVTWMGVQNSGFLFSTSVAKVAYGGAPGQEKFVAVGQGNNSFAYSFDGVTWTGAGGTALTTSATSIMWSSTQQIWLAGTVSSSTTFPNGYAYSYDGIVWYGASAPANYVNSFTGNGVAYGNGVFVTVFSNSTSTNGLLAYANEEPGNAAGDFRWSQIGYNSVAVSDDGGTTWNGVPGSAFNMIGYTAAWNGAKWIVAGSTTITTTVGISLLSDSTAKTWGSFNNALYSVKWLPGISRYLLAVNNAGVLSVGRTFLPQIARSSDGLDWTWCDTGAINNMAFTNLNNIPTTQVFGSFAEKPGTPPLVICCGRATMSNSLNASFIFRSNDGITWTRSIEPFQTSFVLYVPFTVNPVFMVLSGNFVVQSANAITWTPTRLFADLINATAAAWSPALGKVCVIGNGTNFPLLNSAVSSDGITWEYGTIPANSFTTLEWSPNLAIFCALLNTDRNQQQCLISGDGKNWYNTNTLNTNNSFTGLVWSPELQMFCGIGFNSISRPYGVVSKLLQ